MNLFCFDPISLNEFAPDLDFQSGQKIEEREKKNPFLRMWKKYWLIESVSG